jgi:hypothetical protein
MPQQLSVEKQTKHLIPRLKAQKQFPCEKKTSIQMLPSASP